MSEHISSYIGSLYGNAVSADPERQAEALDQIRTLRLKLAEHGFETTDEIEEIPAQLRARATAEHQENLKASADAINDFIKKLKQSEQSGESNK